MYYLYYNNDKTIKSTDKDKVLMKLYMGEAVIPEKLPKKEVTAYENKINISKIDNKVPLYDEHSHNMFLVPREKVYNKVVYESYRFPDNDLKKILEQRKKEYEKIKNKDILQEREHRKLCLMLKYLTMFDYDTLKGVYMRVFYESSEEGNNITVCVRPSFKPHLTHINPYYTKSELINLSLNMELKGDNIKDIMKICEIIKQNDISANILTEHQEHIIEKRMIGLVKYYSLQGSYFVNKYLRNQVAYQTRNILLEDIIRSLWRLVQTAPAFDKSYILYRFVYNDEHLAHLKIGDVYIDQSFMSTTRNPFYRSDEYNFGLVLMKIKIPKGVKGVGLCIETFSNFKKEEEIILCPLSQFRLDKRDQGAKYFHTDENVTSTIKTKYEFTYLGNNPIELMDRPETSIGEAIDFLKIEKSKALTLSERIAFFSDKYVNEMHQFDTHIGGKRYTIITEWFDSTSVYRSFYASKTSDGYSIYTIDKDNLLFFIELNEVNGEAIMYVNYYFRYSVVGENRIDDSNLMDFICSVAYYFNAISVILYAEYNSCGQKDYGKKEIYKTGGNYCVDFYNYFKKKKKRYHELDSTEIKTGFSYYELDRLKQVKPSAILSKEDRDIIYQIYEKVYLDEIDKNGDNLADFYVWIIDNYCVYEETLVDKMERYFLRNNPFNRDHYIVDPFSYLYNRNLISNYVKLTKKEINQVDTKRDSKNEYRLEHATDDRYPKNEYRLEYGRDDRYTRS